MKIDQKIIDSTHDSKIDMPILLEEYKKLKDEHAKYQLMVEEQVKFKQLVSQVSHDIRSPLSTLLMVVNSEKASKEIPEQTRVTIRNSVTRINDIANHLLSHHESKKTKKSVEINHQDFLVSEALQQIMAQKRYEYKKLNLKFDYQYSQESVFAFINIEPTAFRQMISNIINNAVDAFDIKEGKVTVCLESNDRSVNIKVKDDGKGMPPHIVDKIMNNIAVTNDKKDGHGIGFVQIRETLHKSDGQLKIDSQEGVGTTISLAFKRLPTPEWIAEKIELSDDDLIVILDDDPTIHGAWQTKFKIEAPEMRLKHFSQGEETVNYINSLDSEAKEKVLLLTDYELLEQELHGLDVISKTQLKRSILVTSHADNSNVRKLAKINQAKILPKVLASDILISIEGSTKEVAPTVDMIIVDDDKFFVDALCNSLFSDKKIVSYRDPVSFLDEVRRFDKNIVICLDNDYKNFSLTGLEVAKTLHGYGYSNLYLISGSDFTSWVMPDYLTVILKTDVDSIERIARPINQH